MIAEAVTTVGIAGVFYLLLRRYAPGEKTKPVQVKEKESRLEQLEEKGEQGIIAGLFAEAEHFLKSGQFAEAVSKLLLIERRQPHHPKLYNRLGIAYLEEGEYQRAVEAFERAVREDPSKAARHANLGMAYLQIKKVSLAKKSFERAIDLEPKNEKYKRLLEQVDEN